MAEAAGDVSRVLECYGQAHEANPAWDLAAYNLASAERRAGRASRALELFAGVMRASPSAATRAGAHFHTAELLDEAGDRERAIGHLESCLIENPGHRRASELLLAWAGAGVATAAAVPHRGGTDG
jgi:tetratricopeptide (TPR) repeat protein